jgi:hypothetical protein
MKMVFPRITLLFLFFLLTGFEGKVSDDELSKILGSWEFSAPRAGNRYHKGELLFTNQNDGLKGEVRFGDQLILMRNLVYENDKVRAYIMLSGAQIDLYIKFQKDSFACTVSNPRGYIRVLGVKKQ